jgi:hypothetical protein
LETTSIIEQDLIMDNLPSSTQFLPATNLGPSIAYEPFSGDWPVFNQVDVPLRILERIKTEANGSALSSNIDFLSLGYYYIDTTLLAPHPTQRQIDQDHVMELGLAFENKGILRGEKKHAGVVIGLGNGWYQMKKDNPKNIMISPTSPHLPLLSSCLDGPIAEIIRGNHRCAAIKRLSKTVPAYKDQNFWYFQVLVPGNVLFHLFLTSISYPFLKPPTLFLAKSSWIFRASITQSWFIFQMDIIASV